ncbi:acetate kinase [Sulfuritortus calidifontis]|uniref:Acetate kinase n=1 Tax=Sulfuritortus calidifontis TaxID=1914471 RepID=A0A4R3JWL6_9PROT|nr:acetate/propionate family kinase [Sulfuritortus calidifontis]TCS72650.1 acetate kinase [Sulfuritortus calidifontis]
MDNAILIINAGSSSLKFALYRVEPGPSFEPWYRGIIEEIGGASRMRVSLAPTAEELLDQPLAARDHDEAIWEMLAWLAPRLDGLDLIAAGHRVVHGGAEHAAPVRVDETVLTKLERLIPIDPLHQPHNLAGIRALLQARPGLPQVACFDTAFHRTLPELAQRFALPRELHDAGVRRYGFHGLSYEYIASVLPDYLGDRAEGRVIVAHLGNGASLCAMQNRRSVETTMSFTPLDGLPMGTRCGAIDPAIPLYLMREQGLDLAAVSELLHQRSGLLGLSGTSSDMRQLLEGDTPAARLAVAHFVYQVAKAVGALAVALDGLDALVFTAGIGEHAAPVRAAICARLGWLGLTLDPVANAAHGPCISQPDSPIGAWVIPTDEELVIARQTYALAAA